MRRFNPFARRQRHSLFDALLGIATLLCVLAVLGQLGGCGGGGDDEPPTVHADTCAQPRDPFPGPHERCIR